jgi:hypothetical protein
MATSSTHNGWRYDKANSRLDIYYRGTRVGHVDASGLSVTGTLTGGAVANDGTIEDDITITGDLAVGDDLTVTGEVAGTLTAPNISTPAETGAGATIASGVLTVTDTVVIPLPESGTSDTIDTITKAGVVAGDLLLLHVPATNTITVDDANVNLAAATRAIAPGGSLFLVYDGTQWSEISFVAATDNT